MNQYNTDLYSFLSGPSQSQKYKNCVHCCYNLRRNQNEFV